MSPVRSDDLDPATAAIPPEIPPHRAEYVVSRWERGHRVVELYTTDRQVADHKAEQLRQAGHEVSTDIRERRP